jgi:hypothetical protein
LMRRYHVIVAILALLKIAASSVAAGASRLSASATGAASLDRAACETRKLRCPDVFRASTRPLGGQLLAETSGDAHGTSPWAEGPRVEPGHAGIAIRRKHNRLSRRCLVASALFGGRCAPRALAAEPPPSKVTQQEAQYQPMPKNGVRCAFCTFFRPPASCTVVQGVITPQGWCKFFDLPD